MILHDTLIKDINTGNIFIGSIDKELVGQSDYPFVQLTDSETQLIELQRAKANKKEELENWKQSKFKELLQVRSDPDYYVKPSPTENIFQAYNSMTTSSIKEWRAMDSKGNKLHILDEDGNKTAPLFLELTKAELKSVSNHYEERKTAVYKEHDLKLFQIEEVLNTIEEVEAFDVTQI